MHELSVCLALLDQVTRIAADHGAERVERIVLAIGPLAGVEPALLRNAWPLAAAGTLAEAAELVIDTVPVRVACNDCGAEGEATANRLLCPVCGSWRTRLVSGNELLLAHLELSIPDP